MKRHYPLATSSCKFGRSPVSPLSLPRRAKLRPLNGLATRLPLSTTTGACWSHHSLGKLSTVSNTVQWTLDRAQCTLCSRQFTSHTLHHALCTLCTCQTSILGFNYTIIRFPCHVLLPMILTEESIG